MHWYADPFKNDQNYILSVLSLEELGATGNKVIYLVLLSNVSPSLQDVMAHCFKFCVWTYVALTAS